MSYQVAVRAVLLLGLAAPAAQAVAVDIGGTGPALQEALRGAGWELETLADGSVQLRMAPAPAAPVDDEPAGASDAAMPEPVTADPQAVAWDRLRVGTRWRGRSNRLDSTAFGAAS